MHTPSMNSREGVALDQGSDSPWVKEEEVPGDTSECETGESRKTLG